MLSVFAGKTIHSIAIKKPFLFSLNYFGSICNKSVGVLVLNGHKRAFWLPTDPNIQYVWFLYTHKTHLLFLPGVAELKLNVIDPIIL